MSLRSLQNAYRSGRLAKADFSRQAYEGHRMLFEYAELLPETSLDAIAIRDGSVCMHSRLADVWVACPPGDERVPPLEALNFLAYEPEETAMMRRLLRPGMTVFDIGANIGWFALHYARWHPDCCIHAFEPVPGTYERLTENVRRNPGVSVTCHPFAFGAEEGELTFYLPVHMSAAASAARKEELGETREETCRVRLLDRFVDETRAHPDFIKCDVEGAELLVFQGGRETLRKARPVVVTELLRKWAATFDYHPNEVLTLFAELGYACFTIAGDSLVPFARMTEESLATNFVFLHRQAHADRIAALTSGEGAA
jgi:FkbM family methyltransferase